MNGLLGQLIAFFVKFPNPPFSYRFPPLHPHWWSRSLYWWSRSLTRWSRPSEFSLLVPHTLSKMFNHRPRTCLHPAFVYSWPSNIPFNITKLSFHVFKWILVSYPRFSKTYSTDLHHLSVPSQKIWIFKMLRYAKIVFKKNDVGFSCSFKVILR